MSRKEKHANYSKEFAKLIIPIALGSIIFLCAMLWLSGCTPKVGSCTNHQERKAQRLLSKSYTLCDKPFIELAAKRFDNTVYVHDTTWQTTTFPIFDTLFVGDTVLVVKTDTKVVNHTITKQFENKAAIEQLQAENDKLRVDLTSEQVRSEAYKTKSELDSKSLKDFRTKVFGSLFLVVICVVGFFAFKAYAKPISLLH